GALFTGDLTAVQAAHERVVAVGAEHPVHPAQFGHHGVPRHVGTFVSRMAASQSHAHRHAHDMLHAAVDLHSPASSSAACRDWMYPLLVTVAPLIIAMSELWASIVSSTRIGR